jgi:tetratricopeptide (TPR) repeat protein
MNNDIGIRNLTFDELVVTFKEMKQIDMSKIEINDSDNFTYFEDGSINVDSAKTTAVKYFESGLYKISLEIDSHDFLGSIQDFNKAIELDPNYSEAYYCRGFTKMYLLDYKSAVIDFSMVIKLAPNYVKAYIDRGISKFRMALCPKDAEEAINDFNRAIELEPENSQAYFTRGIVNLTINKESGFKDLLQAYVLGSSEALVVIAEEELLEFVTTENYELLAILCSEYSNDKSFDHYKNGQYQDGIDSVIKALKIFPRAIYLDTLALGYYYLEDYKLAIEASNNCIEIDIDKGTEKGEHYTTRAKINIKLNHIEKAIEDLRKALELDPDYEEAIQLLKSLK